MLVKIILKTDQLESIGDLKSQHLPLNDNGKTPIGCKWNKFRLMAFLAKAETAFKKKSDAEFDTSFYVVYGGWPWKT